MPYVVLDLYSNGDSKFASPESIRAYRLLSSVTVQGVSVACFLIMS